MVQKYIKKPIEIEAFQYDGDFINREGEYYIPDWAIEAHKKGDLFYASMSVKESPSELFIKTLEGDMHVSVGDYVIKGVKGELYPCKPDIFEMTYDKSATTFLERLEKEHKELEVKYNKLLDFLLSNKYNELSKTQQDLLIDQASIMARYIVVLERRLENIKGDE